MFTYNSRLRLSSTLLILAICALTACSNDQQQSASTELSPALDDVQYIEKGDLDALKNHHTLRILLPRFVTEDSFLPRKGFPLLYETDMLALFAKQVGLDLRVVYVDDFNMLIPKLLRGEGDLIAANLTITEDRSQQIGFTAPVKIVREQLITRLEDTISNVDQLSNRRVAVQESSSYYDTVQKLIEKHSEIHIDVVPENINIFNILDAVADGSYDTAVSDNNIIEAVLTYNNKLKVAFDISEDRAIAWGIRPTALKLKNALDSFIKQQHFQTREYPVYKTDFTEIKKRKKLRVLTRNNAANYFLWRGELLGFEYELVHEFAKQNDLKLEMIVPPSRVALSSWLLEGRGDLIAASLTINPAWEKRGIVFSNRTKEVTEKVVTRASDNTLNVLSDLAHRTIYVRKSSAYWNSLNKLRNNGLAINIQSVPEELETEEIIAKVASGEYDLTVSDSHILDIELTWRDDIKAPISLDNQVAHGWAVRAQNKELLKAVNDFIDKEYRGLFYNITHRKYFEKPRTIRKRLSQRVDGPGNAELSPYDELVKPLAQKYGFDWRLIVAQMYQESRFNPQAKSWAGAKGLMQIMPIAAKQLNISSLVKPSKGIEAGVRYMQWLKGQLEPELLDNERTWFTLAAYNAGIGHVRDARRLAKQKGWRSSQWFGNVEKAMLLLSNKEYAKKARHGYVRGEEPIKYVREISNRYKAYMQLTTQASLQSPVTIEVVNK